MAESSADRRRVKLSTPPPEPVPEWFARAFAGRQRRLRDRLTAKLTALGDAELTASQLHQLATHWDRLEVQHALDDLVGLGVLGRETRTEPVALFSCTVKDFTYYYLTPEGAKP